jgi:hypothetical protein
MMEFGMQWIKPLSIAEMPQLQPAGHVTPNPQNRLHVRLRRQILPEGQGQLTCRRQLLRRGPHRPLAQVTESGRDLQCFRRLWRRARRRHLRRLVGSASF